MTDPGPANTWVFIDEHPDSINDGGFAVMMSAPEIVDIPSTTHNAACGFAFADGHAEIHKWVSPELRAIRVTYGPGNPLINRRSLGWNNKDLQWMRLRTTSDKRGIPVR